MAAGLLFVFLVCVFFRLLPSVFVALALAYAFSPIVDFLERKGVPRTWSAAGLLASLALVIVLSMVSIVPALSREAKEFFVNFPDYFSAAIDKVSKIGELHGVRVPLERELLETIRDALKGLSLAELSPVVPLAKRVFSGAGSVINFVLNLLTMPVFLFFFLRDFPAMVQSAFGLVPPEAREAVQEKARRMDEVFSGFIRGQMLVALILAGVFSVGLLVIGVPFGLFIGILAGVLNIVPFLGQITGLALSLILAMVDFPGWARFLAIPALFAAANFVEGNFITPKIVGKKVGLSTAQAILALLLGGKIGGLVGLIVAVPVAGCAKVLLLDGIEKYRRSSLYAPKTENRHV
ncbi:MAG: AI-2E family transporter [Elusimicrobia bacterium]|nr:AI-2E family transporter [Elusimicrobiota bacterium]